ncbi:DUF1295 domain-containing protein [Spongiibacter sp. IMCC21906]|uniref:DUF1295 domain-containing protein n=1 Tax=Spongiibacter sp. IMCC21906 TaxID=1620392 RepID=UPI0012E032AD|nr:DUF1295 domain-containing protein [Spongiibacter sp. IMCC21906]
MMNKWPSLAAVLVVVLIAALIATLAGQNLSLALGVNSLLLLAGWIFLIQWLGFLHAWFTQTERYYDLLGSLTYISATVLALGFAESLDVRRIILAAVVLAWAGRLGMFLFKRIVAAGKDSRFDDIKPYWYRFLMAWTLQGLWVFLTLSGVLICLLAKTSLAIGYLGVLGLLVWLAGFVIEVFADAQKQEFRKNPANRQQFIHSGLWAWSRHPNYFGEIVMWLGVALMALPVFAGWQYLGLVSPLFVYLVLTKISGIPMLEKSAESRWGDDPAYQAYVRDTPVLWPKAPRSSQ